MAPQMVPRGRPPESVRPTITNPGELVELGRVVKRHGIRGEVRVLSHNPESAAMTASASIVLTRDDGTREWRRVLEARRHKQFALLRLEGVATVNDAEALIGCGVAVPREQLPPPGAAVYHIDLIGCAVRTTSGEALGTVEELIVTGSNDVCVVRGAGREVLIPLIADVIVALDPSARTIVVNPLPGLIDA
jgi:16S rRNA processing protein RimM